MRELTKAEEQVMQILWQMDKGFVKDILDRMEKPRPAYNTISTIVRILEKKGFVGYVAYGKTHEYYPLVDKTTYTRFYLKNFLKGYFGGSFAGLVSFFAKNDELDIRELEELLKRAKNQDDEG